MNGVPEKQNKKVMGKGFTLIELLAVIVILAVIALIAAPRVMNAIEEARLNSTKNSVYGIVKAAEVLYAEKQVSDNPLPRNENILEEIDFTGSRPDSGEVIISNNGKAKVALVYGERCFFKINDEIEVTDNIEDCNLPESGSGDLVILFEDDDIAYLYDGDNMARNSIPCLVDGSEFTHINDKRDDTSYKVTQIGDQCWSAENLSYTGNGCLGNAWNSSLPFNACDTHSLDWGVEVLYQLGAAMNGSSFEGSQGLCPVGWHIPSDDDWKQLEMQLGMSQAEVDASGYRETEVVIELKDDLYWDGVNSVGFGALPAGHRWDSAHLLNAGTAGVWWTSSISGSEVWRRSFPQGSSHIGRYTNSQANGSSVRCIMSE